MIKLLNCLRCDHKWASRLERLPKVCPKCKSPYWNSKKRKKKSDVEVIDKKENTRKFKQRLNTIINEIIYARGCFGIWEQLWPKNEKVARVENRYRSFFRFTRTALNEQLFLSLAKVVEKRQRKENLNIWRLIESIEEYPSLISKPLDVESIKSRLDDKSDIFDRIIYYRDKELAHIDDKYLLSTNENKKVKLLFGDVKALLKELEEIVDEISVAHNGNPWRFETLDHNDTTGLLNDMIDCIYEE